MHIIDEFPKPVREIEHCWILLSDGCHIAARIWLPGDVDETPAPAILEYLPYRKRDGTAERDQINHPYLAGHGYACVRVDIRGNGDSEGLMFDEYVQQEQSDALEIIHWIADQRWCSGQVGMLGISWGGFNALQVAALKPDALKAIVTVCSTDDRYADDVHYKGGALLLDNLGWASTMFAYSSRPPDPDVVGVHWREMWLNRLENTPLLIDNWLSHPHLDDYWKHGSICEEYEDITAAVLAVGGWGDAYSNAVPRMLSGLKCPRRGIVGPWIHKYPHFATPGPTIDFLGECIRWWDYWLKGGSSHSPPVSYDAYVMNAFHAPFEHKFREGCWVSEREWPSRNVRTEIRYLNDTYLTFDRGSGNSRVVSSLESVGSQSGKYMARSVSGLPPDQRNDDAGSVVFETVLDEPMVIFGALKVHLKIMCNTFHANVVARVCDVNELGASTRVSYGVLNLCHQTSSEFPTQLTPGEWYTVTIQLDDVAYRFEAGHRLRIALSNNYWPLIWPSSLRSELIIQCNEYSYIELPLYRNVDQLAVGFESGRSAPPLEVEVLRKPSNRITSERDVLTGFTTTRYLDDFGERFENILFGNGCHDAHLAFYIPRYI